MFIITAKLSKRKLVLGVAALAAILLAVGAAAGLAGDVAVLERQGETAGSAEQAEQTVSTLALTNEARVDYLKACGWEVDAEACTIRDVIIPEEFDETYQKYADLQARQGFDLERLKGKRVKQVTYPVTNYPDDTEVIAELLIYRGNVVAGDISSMKTDGGFTRGLMDHPDTDSTNTQDDSDGN